MHVPPHMREAGGGSCPLFPPTPIVGSRCGQQVWAASVGSRCGQQVWAAGV